jgi:AmiR/NasT family two-component response regulator
LNVYCDVPRSWSDSEVDALRAYSSLIGALLVAALQAHERGELAEQLQHALANRVTIERAVGVIMLRDGTDAVTAFDSLRRRARSAGRKVAHVAADLLDSVSGEPR